MTGATGHEDLLPLADKIYAARTALTETKPGATRFGVAEIVQFLSDPQRSLSMEQQQRLFADPRLRVDYRRLKSELATLEMPALAAASVGDVNERRFTGGTIRVHPSRVGGQVYVVLKFTAPTGQPRSILLEAAGNELVKRSLPNADASGEIVIVLDPKNPTDETFLRLIRDPSSIGSFLL